MEDDNISVLRPQTKVDTESLPTRAVKTTAVEVAVTAAGTDENPTVNVGVNGEVTVRRKRGRPRKHPVDETATLPIAADFLASEGPIALKRRRGRPRGTGKLQMLASLGGLAIDTAGGDFTPHAVTIQTGEDIIEKILSFSHRGPRAICVLAASGPVSIVDIRPAGSFGSGILRYEGHFEILTLTGSHAFTEVGGVRRKIGMLSVSLASPDGRVFGGAIAGSLIAAGPIQLILASFKQGIKKQLLKRHSGESSSAIGMLSDLDTVRVPRPNGKTANVEENCVVTPPSPFPEPPNGAVNIISDQNVNHVSPQSFEQEASQPSEHMSDESMSDINGGVLGM